VSGWLSIDIQCTNPDCQTATDLVVRRDEAGDSWECPDCGGEMKRAYLSVPMPLRKSFRDGVRRKNFREGIEALRLEADSYNLPVEKRGEINKEIKKLREVKK
jgi:ribosomal protein L37AE/L43A